MIQIQIFCDTCKSNLSAIFAARKAQSVTAGIVGLLYELHDPQCKEDDDGQDQAEPGGKAGLDEPSEGEDGSTSGTPWERAGRA